MPRGILELAGLAVTLAFAAPVALLGVDWLVRGRPMGLVFLAMAAGMVAVEEYLVGPQDLPFRVLAGAAGRVAKDPDEEE
jgi:hypothetical protein